MPRLQLKLYERLFKLALPEIITRVVKDSENRILCGLLKSIKPDISGGVYVYF